MAFWGVELQPGERCIHSCKNSKGRLRISQATLGIGNAGKKGFVQCVVGNRTPVLLCALLPNKIESLHLDLEFDEAEDVVLSVIGSRSVHLTGYYLQICHQPNPHNDTESYGVDTEKTHTEGSSFCSDDDKYEDSFIHDPGLQVSCSSPLLSSRVGNAVLEKDKPIDIKGCCKLLRMRNQEIESDGDRTQKLEDEDDHLLSVLNSRRLETTISDDAENIAQVLIQMGERAEDNGNRGSRSMEKVDADIRSTPESIKPKRKRTHSLPEENCDIEIANVHVSGMEKMQEVESSINLYLVPPTESPAENSRESKKRGEELQPKEASADEIGGKCDDIPKDFDFNHGLSCAESTGKILLTENGEHQEQAMDNQPTKKIKKKRKKKAQGEGCMDRDMAKVKDNQENMVIKYEDQTVDPLQVRKITLPNGLIVEELSHGPRDGKTAAFGKKIKVFYTGMLRESGQVFDSNIDGTACSCRLGDEEFIDGWNIGIDGMHIGDKRRLIIPPSMGFGSHGVGESVPPDSWLVYYVELVNVRP